MKLRITQLIPAILGVSALLCGFLMFNYATFHEEGKIKKEALEHLNLDITRLQNILYNLMTEGNLSDARLNISVMAMEANYKKIFLINELDGIVIANRYTWEGSKAGLTSHYKPDMAEQIKRTNQLLCFILTMMIFLLPIIH